MVPMSVSQGGRAAGVTSVMLLLALFAATGALTHASSSSKEKPSLSSLPAVERTGPGESTIWFVHPAWGLVRLVTHRNSDDGRDPGPASLTVRDASGAVKFSWWNEHMYWFAPAGTRPTDYGEDDVQAPIDERGNVFLDYNPGRYNGVVVIVPTETGLDDLGTLPPPPDDYAGRFYCAATTDLDADGVFEIVEPKFCECAPECLPEASAHTYRWNGADYVER
jgi:hypothetical protein